MSRLCLSMSSSLSAAHSVSQVGLLYMNYMGLRLLLTNVRGGVNYIQAERLFYGLGASRNRFKCVGFPGGYGASGF
jgi:hypothetical protein